MNKKELPDFENAVVIENVSIVYGNTKILHKINWKIKKGDKWALTGPNGSGKSTLLSLLNADNPQSYACEIVLFDKKRGTGENIWDIKSKIGFLSPELHLHYKSDKKCAEIIKDGFEGQFGTKSKISGTEEKILSLLFDYFDAGAIINRNFNLLSPGEQKLILFMAIIFKNPAMLILDEPFQGMDEKVIKKCLKLLSVFCKEGRTLIFVTHIENEIPACINKILKLKEGRVNF